MRWREEQRRLTDGEYDQNIGHRLVIAGCASKRTPYLLNSLVAAAARAPSETRSTKTTLLIRSCRPPYPSSSPCRAARTILLSRRNARRRVHCSCCS